MTPTRRALRVTLGYLVFGVLWVLFSDGALNLLELPLALYSRVQSVKGTLYVLLTAGLFFWLARRELIRQARRSQAAHQREQELSVHFRSIFEQAAVGMARVGVDGRLLQMNTRFCKFLGRSEAELRALSWQDVTHPEDLAESREFLSRLLNGEIQEFSQDKRYIRADGEIVWGRLTVSAGQQPGVQPDYLVSVLQDITESKRTEAALRHSQTMLARTERIANVGSWEWDIANDRVIWSEELFRIFQRDPAAGAPPYAEHPGVYGPADFQRLDACVQAAISDGTPFELELQVCRPSGEIRHAISRGEALRDGNGRITHLYGSCHDITALRRSQAELHRLAHQDTLTGLPNRVLFQQRVEAAIRSARCDDGFALLFLDLDRFKHVNDTLGHQIGDRLLQQVARALAREIADTDTLARFGGDEFVVLMKESVSGEAVGQLAGRLLAVFTRPFTLGGREFYLTGSVGVSVYPRDGENLDTLLRNADIAMYQSKAQSRNGYCFFKAAMLERVTERLHLENALRGALERAELSLHYQPQVNLVDGCLLGAEALLRWQHPQLGRVAPDVFIPVAEEMGLIRELGVWALEQACRQLRIWDDLGLRLGRLAVNLAVQQLEDESLPGRVGEILARTGVAPGRLELEVTESTLMRSPDIALASLRALRAMGISVAIDDFGTGYSSLGYLRQLPIDLLKIDQSFIQHLVADGGEDAAIVRAVMALAAALELRVLAEGVETEAQAEFLRRAGCQEAQGYLYGRPLVAAQFAAAWLGTRVN